MPGTYKIRMTFGDQKDSTQITVKDDPRFNTPVSILEARTGMLKELENVLSIASKATDQLRESLEIANEFEKKMKDSKKDELKDAQDKTKIMKDSINVLFDAFLGKKDERQGILFDYTTPISRVYSAQRYINSTRGPINETDQRVSKQAEEKVMGVVERVNRFYSTQWTEYRTLMEKVSLPVFKDYEPLKKQ
jgi:hypothetical protein